YRCNAGRELQPLLSRCIGWSRGKPSRSSNISIRHPCRSAPIGRLSNTMAAMEASSRTSVQDMLPLEVRTHTPWGIHIGCVLSCSGPASAATVSRSDHAARLQSACDRREDARAATTFGLGAPETAYLSCPLDRDSIFEYRDLDA